MKKPTSRKGSRLCRTRLSLPELLDELDVVAEDNALALATMNFALALAGSCGDDLELAPRLA